MASVEDEKARLRKTARLARQAAMAANGPAAATALAQHGGEFFDTITHDHPLKVAGYVPSGSEIDPRQLLSECRSRGWTVALPVVVKENAPLVFRTWLQGDTLTEGAYGIPVPEEKVPEIIPDIVLVPLLAYDHKGYRLGQGGGFYDRTLPILKSGRPSMLAIGVAFTAQRFDAVPTGEFDHRLDAVITDEGWKHF